MWSAGGQVVHRVVGGVTCADPRHDGLHRLQRLLKGGDQAAAQRVELIHDDGKQTSRRRDELELIRVKTQQGRTIGGGSARPRHQHHATLDQGEDEEKKGGSQNGRQG